MCFGTHGHDVDFGCCSIVLEQYNNYWKKHEEILLAKTKLDYFHIIKTLNLKQEAYT